MEELRWERRSRLSHVELQIEKSDEVHFKNCSELAPLRGLASQQDGAGAPAGDWPQNRGRIEYMVNSHKDKLHPVEWSAAISTCAPLCLTTKMGE
jgi:hypothetical protein